MAKIHIQLTLSSAFYAPVISTMAGNLLSDAGVCDEWRVAEPGVSSLAALADGTAHTSRAK